METPPLTWRSVPELREPPRRYLKLKPEQILVDRKRPGTMAVELIDVRTYGDAGPAVVLIHGGPGAPGHMSPIARELAARFRVLEPLQRMRGAEPLTVESHVRDLHEVLVAHPESQFHLVGSSWGAMLALAFAAAHPESVRSIVLIGCGTFDEASRMLYKENLQNQMGPELMAQVAELNVASLEPDETLRRKAAIVLSAMSHDLLTMEFENTGVDAVGNQETWNDMLSLQAGGVYPQTSTRISSPVLMLHGSLDPHPGPAIRDSLTPYLPQLQYHEWKECGHYPWHERSTRNEFYERLGRWLESESHFGSRVDEEAGQP